MSAQNVTRRRCLQLTAGVTAGAAATASPIGPTDEAAAFDWSDEVLKVGCHSGTGYVVRKLDVACTGQEVQPGSSTPEAVAESWYKTGMYAEEENSVTLQTIWNRLEDARTISRVRYKSAALEMMNNDGTEQSVLDSAKSKVNEHYADVQRNLANHVNIQVNKILTANQEIENHSEMTNVTDYSMFEAFGGSGYPPPEDSDHFAGSETTTNVELVDGSTKEVTGIEGSVTWTTDLNGDLGSHTVEYSFDATGVGWSVTLDTHHPDGDPPDGFAHQFHVPGDTLHIMQWLGFDSTQPTAYASLPNHDSLESYFEDSSTNASEFADLMTVNQITILWSKIIDERQQMISDAETWVSNAYGAVQAGDTTVEALATNDPYVLGQEWATSYQKTGNLAYAAADLAIMGLSFDSDNRMSFTLNDGTTLEGTLYTSNDDFSYTVGNEVDPANDPGDFYVAADASTMTRTLLDTEYRESIDQGQLQLRTGVVEDTRYIVKTTAGEEIAVAWDAWTIEDTSANSDVRMRRNAETLVVDLSDNLETPDTSVESIRHVYDGDEAALVMEIKEPFVISEAHDVETGEEVTTVDGQGYDAGSSEVDLSWTEDYLDMRDNTDNYADSGGGGGAWLPTGWDLSIPSLFGGSSVIGSMVKLLVVGVLAFVGYDELVNDDGDDGRAR